jgi:hypothetical protein
MVHWWIAILVPISELLQKLKFLSLSNPELFFFSVSITELFSFSTPLEYLFSEYPYNTLLESTQRPDLLHEAREFSVPSILVKSSKRKNRI